MSFRLHLRSSALAFPLAFAMGTLACGGAQPGSGSNPGESSPSRCVTPEGVSGSPESIDDALALINALPKPTTLPCFLQSLDRPLRLHATSGIVSAQPSQGRRSPRIFLFSPSGSFQMSVVPAGPGAPLLEFGELGANQRSVKAELAFPISEPVAPNAPFTRVKISDTGTSENGLFLFVWNGNTPDLFDYTVVDHPEYLKRRGGATGGAGLVVTVYPGTTAP